MARIENLVGSSLATAPEGINVNTKGKPVSGTVLRASSGNRFKNAAYLQGPNSFSQI